MGFKRTAEGRIFFQGANSNDAPEEAYDLTDEERAFIKTPPRVETPPLAETPVPREEGKPSGTNVSVEIVGLLKSLNEKLQKTQEERDTIRRELSMQRAKMETLETQAEESGRMSAELKEARAHIRALEERAEASQEELEDKYKSLDNVKRRQQALETMQREQQQKLANQAAHAVKVARRVEEAEEKQHALIERIEETVQAQDRLVRQIDKAIQDRARMLRKMERIEETVLQTRDAINANAQLLLAGSGATVNTDEPLLLSQKLMAMESRPWWERMNLRVAGVLALMVAGGLAGGVALTQIDKVKFSGFESVVPEEIAQVVRIPSAIMSENITEPVAALPEMSEQATDIQDFPADPDAALENDIDVIDLQDEVSMLRAMETSPEELAAKLNDIDVGEVPEDIAEGVAEEEIEVASVPAPAPVAEAPSVPENYQGKYALVPDVSLPPVIKEIERQAYQGNAEAQHDLAAIYTAGHGGVTQDYGRSAYWFERAAEGGVANARYNLGVLYQQGIGVDRDLEKALDWYKKAAELDHPEAQYNLGIAYIEGVGVEYDPQKATAYFVNAAAAGIMEAAYNLGLIYENGLLGDAKPDEALKWYKRAADSGSPEAKAALEQLARSLDMKLEDVNRLVDGVNSSSSNAAVKQPVLSEAEKAVRAEQERIAAAQEARRNLTMKVQESLMMAGLYPGPVDGLNGPIMQDAVRTYQIENSLKATGEVSSELLAHMKGLGSEKGLFDQGSRAN